MSIQYQNMPPKKGFSCIKKKVSPNEMPDRAIVTNNPDLEIPNNKISTSKYTLLSFVPKNLLEQFSKIPNIYFLLITFLQMIPQISTSNGIPVNAGPLSVILIISAIKDLFEDLKRHKSDNEENTRKIDRLNPSTGMLEVVQWQNLQVGDVIRVKDKQYFPADVLLLKSSDPKSLAYIETKNLDGETNLKHKKVPNELKRFSNYKDDQISKIQDWVNFEKPNAFLYTFNGTYKLSEETWVSLNSDSFILRGCSLRNTEEIYGLVCYTGHDTKIMLNSISARAKSSKVEKIMNKQVINVFIIQQLFCLFCGLYAAFWYSSKKDQLAYMDIRKKGFYGSFFSLLLVKYGNWLLIFTNFVPISLLVTVEMVKFIQGTFIAKDTQLKSVDPTGEEIFVNVQSSSLNEELGQVEYIFSDKTGTLTCNYMEFMKASINGKSFGDKRDMKKEEIAKLPQVSNVNFNDSTLFKGLKEGDKTIMFLLLFSEMMTAISFCHTIITDRKNGELVYNVFEFYTGRFT